MSNLYEIVEMPNGEIALCRADEGGEPLVSIRFSKESLYLLNELKFDVAKAMIEAGLEIAGAIDSDEDNIEESRADTNATLH